MMDNNTLSLSAQEIDLIEAALHTQEKILSVQSEAGGTGARQRLTDLKRLIKRIGQERRLRNEPSTSGWAQTALHYLTCPSDCRASH